MKGRSAQQAGHASQAQQRPAGEKEVAPAQDPAPAAAEEEEEDEARASNSVAARQEEAYGDRNRRKRTRTDGEVEVRVGRDGLDQKAGVSETQLTNHGWCCAE